MGPVSKCDDLIAAWNESTEHSCQSQYSVQRRKYRILLVGQIPVASSVENQQIHVCHLNYLDFLGPPLICYFFSRYVHISDLSAVKVGKAILG